MTRRGLSLCLAVMIFLAPASCAADDPRSPSAQEPGRAPDFWDLMHLKQDFTYFDTLCGMWKINEVALIGPIRTITEGRTLGGQRGEPGTIDTALVRIQVDEVVRGDLANDSRRIVDIEIWRPESSSPEELAASRPNEPLLVMLQDTAKQPQPEEADDSAVVREPGKTLYTIPTPKALFIEQSGEVFTPLDPQPGPYEESISATTLDGLAEEIRGC